MITPGFLVLLPNRLSFSPDAAYWIGQEPTMKFYEGAPVFAAEVQSEGDYGAMAERSIVEIRCDYFTAGTLGVWNVDLLSNNIESAYRDVSPETVIVFHRDSMARYRLANRSLRYAYAAP